MRCYLPGVLRLALLLLLLVSLAGCRGRRAAQPPAPAVPVEGIVARGDASFAHQHLYGWKQAEKEYARAYQISKSEALKEKLLLTRLLLTTRMIDEDIPGANPDILLADLCGVQSATPRIKALCRLLRRYTEGSGATNPAPVTEPVDTSEIPTFGFDGGVLDTYLRGVYCLAFGILQDGQKPAPIPDSYRESPLFLYLDVSRRTLKRSEELLSLHPEFTELLVFSAEQDVSQYRFTRARASFRRALELVPEFTRAIIGLGNVEFYALEDWDRAMNFYDECLAIDPANTAALFGRGACLHQLGRWTESVAEMDRVLGTDLTRRGRAPKESVRYYQAEVQYYKGYGHYLMGHPSEARTFTDAAKAVNPGLEHVNYLSGVLFFEAGEMPAARREFERLLQRGTSICRVHYYLGRILLETTDPKALDHFLTACSCMQAGVRSYEKQLSRIPELDVEPAERVLVRGRVEKKLLEHQLDSVRLIEIMAQLAERSIDQRGIHFAALMRDVASRIQPSRGNAPAP